MTARWLWYVLCVLGLPLFLWGMQDQRRAGALPESFWSQRLEFPIVVEGVATGSRGHLRSLIERYPAGRELHLVVAGHEHRVTVVPASTASHHVINLVSALFFWAVAMFVFAGRPEQDPGHVFFLSTFTYGLAISVGTVAFPADLAGPGMVRPVLRIACLAVLPVLFVQMSLSFPRRRFALNRQPWLLPGLYAAGATLAAWHSVVLYRYFASPSGRRWHDAAWSERALGLYLATLVAAGCMLMFRSGRRAELSREKRQLKWLWWGITVGITPYVFLHALPTALVGAEIMPIHFTRLFALAVPFSFAFAAAKHKLLDIDIIIRRSVIYGVLAGLLVVVYLFLAALVGGWLAPLVPGSSQVVPLVAALVSVALFGPTRRLVGLWVDRTFFHIRFSYGQALERFHKAIARPRGPEELAHFVQLFVRHMLGAMTSGVVLRSGSGDVVAGDVDGDVARQAFRRFGQGDEGREHPLAAPSSTGMPEIETVDYPTMFSDAGVVLIQPMFAYHDLQGVVLLGQKRNERRYIEEDLELLGGIATAASTALERVNLAQRLAEERIVREQLDELSRMKSDFFSRVAHDLRSPVTAIDWSARNLLDGLAGPLQPSQTTYLQAILASSVHLGRLVTNLLAISRMEAGEASIELAPVEMAPAIEESMIGLLPIAEARGVRFERRMAAGLAPVLGHRENLVQAVVNLLENAIRYAPPGTTVEVGLEPRGDGSQRLSVRDFGPGIRAGEEEAIFERFRQGAPSPYAQSQGFGLGLYVVRAHVESCSGDVRASTHPQGGAEFVVTLRECAPREPVIV